MPLLPIFPYVDQALLDRLALRGSEPDSEIAGVVAGIIEDVRARGDDALLDQARRFDAPGMSSLTPSEDEWSVGVSAEFGEACARAATRIGAFHDQQLANLRAGGALDWRSVGVGQRMIPVRRVGVYVPGGRADYPSSVLMNAIPARSAGVAEIVVTTPASSDGNLSAPVLHACRLVGASQVVKVGGAGAIVALALGTETVKKVDVIVGPGNRFVNEAKRQLWGRVGLDGFAGPSEVCVVVDGESNAQFAAADLLTQIEHAPDNAGFLISLSESKLSETLVEVEKQLQNAPRADVMRQALREQSMAILVRDKREAVEVINAIAPEHLTLSVSDPEKWLDLIENAGCILLGEQSAESAGDYAAGPSHTLPTAQAARFGSPVNVLHFLKVQSVINLAAPLAQELAPIIETFGEIEGFPQHALGGRLRASS